MNINETVKDIETIAKSSKSLCERITAMFKFDCAKICNSSCCNQVVKCSPIIVANNDNVNQRNAVTVEVVEPVDPPKLIL